MTQFFDIYYSPLTGGLQFDKTDFVPTKSNFDVEQDPLLEELKELYRAKSIIKHVYGCLAREYAWQ